MSEILFHFIFVCATSSSVYSRLFNTSLQIHYIWRRRSIYNSAVITKEWEQECWKFTFNFFRLFDCQTQEIKFHTIFSHFFSPQTYTCSLEGFTRVAYVVPYRCRCQAWNCLLTMYCLTPFLFLATSPPTFLHTFMHVKFSVYTFSPSTLSLKHIFELSSNIHTYVANVIILIAPLT